MSPKAHPILVMTRESRDLGNLCTYCRQLKRSESLLGLLMGLSPVNNSYTLSWEWRGFVHLVSFRDFLGLVDCLLPVFCVVYIQDLNKPSFRTS